MKRLLLLSLILSVTQLAYAETPTVKFAMQAGFIGGVSKACNQDIGLYSDRVLETIKAISQNNDDSKNAENVFQQNLLEAFNKQNTSHGAPCDQVAKDFKTIPLLNDNYKTEVIAKLKDSLHANANTSGKAPEQTANNASQPPVQNTTTQSK